MIDARELRIGNWVKTMSEKQPYLQLKSGEEIDYAAVYNEPIPLTEDVILKLGFKNNKAMYSLPDNCVINFDLTYVAIYSERLEDDVEYDLPKYLHQLQNLYYSLTGNELIYSPN